MYSAGKLCNDPKFDGRRSQRDTMAILEMMEVGEGAMDELDVYFGSLGVETIDGLTTQEQFDEAREIFDTAFVKTWAICVPPDEQ